jgi:hypothetical protein
VKAAILKASADGTLTEPLLDELILRNWPRGEKVVSKDIKIRTFIGQESMRNQLVSHVYDITYGSLRAGVDSLVCVDDSIVRGTTLRRSILRILARLNPKKIVIVSTAPQIRYPDCYGIDMSEIGKFVAFEAVVDLLKESGRTELLGDVYRACRKEIEPTRARSTTCAGSTSRSRPRRSRRGSSKLVRPPKIDWNGEIEIIFQTIENLHAAVPQPHGRLVLHGALPDARRLPRGEPGLRELLREERGKVLLENVALLRILRRPLRPARRVQAGLPEGGADDDGPPGGPRLQGAGDRAGRERLPDRGRRPLPGPRRGGPGHQEPRRRRGPGPERHVPLPGDRDRHGRDHRERPGDLRGAADRGRDARRGGEHRLVRRRAQGAGAREGVCRGLPGGGRRLGRGRDPGASWADRAGTIVLAGSAVGRISPKELRIVGDVRDGDAIVFLASSGVQTNGLTLCRKIAESLPERYATPIGGRPRSARRSSPRQRSMWPFVRECQRRGVRLNYAAHVTGHGWRKLMRLEEPFVYEITSPRPPPAIFKFLMEAGPVAPREAYATFNMGIGFAVYVAPGAAAAALEAARATGYDAWIAGKVRRDGSRKAVSIPSLGLEFEGDTLQVR